MKKVLCMVMVATSLVGGYIGFTSNQTPRLSDLALANIAALSTNENIQGVAKVETVYEEVQVDHGGGVITTEKNIVSAHCEGTGSLSCPV